MAAATGGDVLQTDKRRNLAFAVIVWATINDQVWFRRDTSEHAARYGSRFCRPRDSPLRHSLHSQPLGAAQAYTLPRRPSVAAIFC